MWGEGGRREGYESGQKGRGMENNPRRSAQLPKNIKCSCKVAAGQPATASCLTQGRVPAPVLELPVLLRRRAALAAEGGDAVRAIRFRQTVLLPEAAAEA